MDVQSLTPLIISAGAQVGAIITITKTFPFLKRVFKKIYDFISGSKRDSLLTLKMEESNTNLLNKIDNLSSNLHKEIETFTTSTDKKIDGLCTKIEDLSQKVDGNERDRLRRIIFQYGNYARQKQKISGEEFRFLQTVYEKYKSPPLNGNGIADREYSLIENYYNESISGDKDNSFS